MPVRCPACKFESADDAAWCDFCKEPFRKAAVPPAPLDPKKLDELLAAGDGQAVPKAPPWLRLAAWCFLGIWLIWGMVLMGVAVARRHAAQERPSPAPRP